MRKEVQENQHDQEDNNIGDKVRIRSGPSAGARGVIRAVANGLVEVQLDANEMIRVAPEEVTNYSRAARRAWQVMPKRAGRPQLPTPRKKMVSVRLDVDVWDQLGKAVELGLIPGREQALNMWLREHLDILFGGRPPDVPHQ
jgi:uncharacterized protein (DUF4415 family)